MLHHPSDDPNDRLTREEQLVEVKAELEKAKKLIPTAGTAGLLVGGILGIVLSFWFDDDIEVAQEDEARQQVAAAEAEAAPVAEEDQESQSPPRRPQEQPSQTEEEESSSDQGGAGSQPIVTVRGDDVDINIASTETRGWALFSEGNKLTAYVVDDEISITDSQRGYIQEIAAPDGVRMIGVSPDDKVVAVATNDNKVMVWRIEDGAKIADVIVNGAKSFTFADRLLGVLDQTGEIIKIRW